MKFLLMGCVFCFCLGARPFINAPHVSEYFRSLKAPIENQIFLDFPNGTEQWERICSEDSNEPLQIEIYNGC